ncbi:MerR family transcriptional regulator [Nocardia lasii]|uniref:MerR family transcriptional regulator n=1 Tax=Nocardia lasii TaxID=1616107 RepID=A0ABW1JRF4_9NOCA
MTQVRYTTIGELAARSGVAVRTIRFYCDEGLLDATRTATGHRVFDPAAVERLMLLRRLRSFGIGLSAIQDILTGARSIAEVVAAERRTLDDDIDALNHRRALLRAVESGTPDRCDEHLNHLAAVIDPRAAREALITFWRRQLSPLPSSSIDGFLAMNVPELTPDAPPEHLIAYAELVAAVSNPDVSVSVHDTLRHHATPGVRDERRLLLDIADTCLEAAPHVAAATPPTPGPELDHYVTAHATARSRRDTPAFRHQLLRDAPGASPHVRRYWQLTTTLTPEPTSGTAQLWLSDALAASVESEGRC